MRPIVLAAALCAMLAAQSSHSSELSTSSCLAPAPALVDVAAVGAPAISAGGRWLAFLTSRPTESGEVQTLVLADSSTGQRQCIEIGADWRAEAPFFSPGGRWIAYRKTERAAAQRRASHTLILLETSTGAGRELHDVSSFAFTTATSGVSATFADANGSYDLTLLDLTGNGAETLHDIAAHALSPSRTLLAYTTGESVTVRNLAATNASRSVAQTRAEQLIWSPSNDALAVIPRETDATALILVRHLNGPDIEVRAFSSLQLAGAEDRTVRREPYGGGYDARVAPFVVRWRSTDDGVFLWLTERQAPIRAEATGNTQVRIWNAQDALLPTVRELRQREGARPTLALASWERGSITPLSPREAPNALPADAGEFVLAYDDERYVRTASNSNSAFGVRDYFLVNIASGAASPLVEGLFVSTRPGLENTPQISPDGVYAVFQQNGDYISVRLRDRVRANISRRAPTQFYLEQNERNQHLYRRPDGWANAPVLQGWSRDGRYVLISDHFDVWALPLDGQGAAINLTSRSPQRQRTYQRLTGQSGANSDWVDLSAPILFSVRHLTRGWTGLARRHGQAPAQLTFEADANLTYFAEGDHPRAAFRETWREPRELYLVDVNGAPSANLSRANDGLSSVIGEARYIPYGPPGSGLAAVLRTPAGASAPFPTIVTVYEEVPTNHNTYISRSNQLFPWLERGYATLFVGMPAGENRAGDLSVRYTREAVSRVVSSGLVDERRLGLVGYSHGAYKVNYIVTQTDMFAAAVSIAGVTNLWANAGSVYAISGQSGQSMMLSGQGYMGAPWRTDLSPYLSQSPLTHVTEIRTPLLLVHGTADQAVPFDQSRQLIVAMQHAGVQEAILLEYAGAGHTDVQPNNRNQGVGADVQARMLDFFGYYLRGNPPAPWLAPARSYELGAAPHARNTAQ